MLKTEYIKTYGWETAVRGMRNTLNSWSQSDSEWDFVLSDADGEYRSFYQIGDNDLRLMRKLVAAGPDHAKFLRMIGISMDIVAPRYWWAEYDTYKVGTVTNSCSTMHKIAEKEFTLDDFSHEHLDRESLSVLRFIVGSLEFYRREYNRTRDKNVWWRMIQLLPSSYNQRRTVTLNYEVARRMYHARANHKLDEWRALCEVLSTLPYADALITT